MRMNEPSPWALAGADGAKAFAEILATGQAIEVSHMAPKWLSGPVAIETEVFDRFVAWDTEALRRNSVHLEDGARLERMFDACGCAAYAAGGCFICKAVDARGYDGKQQRHVLSMSNFGRASEPKWLIHG